MSFLGGWLGPAFQVLNAQRAGAEQGKAQGDVIAYERKKDEEERQRQLQSDALRNQLLKLQIQHANDPSEWKPTTKQEYLDTHPIKVETPRNTDPLSSEGIAATLRVKRGEAAISHAYPKPPSQTQQNETAEGSAILDRYVNRGAQSTDSQGAAQVGAFGAAFQAIRKTNPTMAPELVARRALDSMKASDPELYRKQSEDDKYSGDGFPAPAPGTVVSHSPQSPVTPTATPAAGSAIGGTIPVKNPDTQKAMAQRWDELTAQGMDGETAKQKVLEEFSGK